jgi:hypothetical protein
MKLARTLLVVLGVVVALLALVIGLALTPAVQRWAILRYAARQPGLKLEVARVSAGPQSLALQGLKMQKGGVTMNLERLDAEYSLFALLWSDRLQLDRLTARGLLVDASHVSRNRAGTGAIAAPAAAPGALGNLQLPAELVIGDLEVEGRALFAAAPGRVPLQADFKLTGGKFAPGREGTLRLQAHVADPAPNARVTALDAQANLQLAQSLRKTFDRVGLALTVDAHGPALPGQRQLKFAAELARGTTGENYRLRLDTVHDGQTDGLLALQAGLPAGKDTFAGDWQLTARTAQIEPFLLGVPMPKFDVHGHGEFSYALRTQTLALHGGLQTEVGELEAVQPALRALGTLRLSSEFDVAATAALARLDNLTLTVAAEKPVIELHAARVALDLQKRRWLFDVDAMALAGKPVVPPEFLHLKLAGLPLAWVRPFVTGLDISGGALTGELTVTTAEGDKLTVQTVAPFAVDDLTLVRAGRVVLEHASLRCEAGAVSEVKDGRLNQIRASLRQFSLKTAAGDSVQAHAALSAPEGFPWPLVVEAGFEADLPRLLQPVFPAGPVRADGTADFTLRADRLEFRTLAAEASALPAGGPGASAAKEAKRQLLGSFKLARAFSFDFAHMRADTGTPADTEVELARLSLGRVPVGPLIHALAPGLNLTATVSPGEIAFIAQSDKLIITARSPLVLSDLSFSHAGQPVLHQVTLQAAPRFELTGPMLTRAMSGEAQLRDATGAQLAMLTGELTRAADDGLRATAGFNLDLPALSAQPALARMEALSAGRASGEIRAAFGGGGAQIEARATLNGLVARDGNQALPVANLGLRAIAQADGHVEISAPVLLDRAGQRSDLNLAAKGARDSGGILLDAQLTGGHVELGDVLLLLSAAGESFGTDTGQSPAAQARALSPPAADARPFWSGVRGQLAVDVKSVTQGKEWTMNGLTARLAIEPTRLQLAKIDAAFSEKSRLTAQGTLEFTGDLDPYRLEGDFSLTEFDTGKLFKAFAPDHPPTLEGLFTVQGRFEGQGLTLDDTLDRARGRFELTSRQGVFRGLKRVSDKASLASKLVGAGAALSSLLGTDKIKHGAEKIAGYSADADELARKLAEINFDQLSVKLSRDEALNTKIENLTLVSRDLRIARARGGISYAADKPLFDQPLTLSIEMTVRGDAERLLQKMDVLTGTKDELGYAKLKVPVPVRGTLARPNPDEFFLKLAEAKLGDLLP